jgi:hypothetical protein
MLLPKSCNLITIVRVLKLEQKYKNTKLQHDFLISCLVFIHGGDMYA